MIGERTAEDIKIRIGSALSRESHWNCGTKGKGFCHRVTEDPQPIFWRGPVRPFLSLSNEIINSVKGVLERTPPELAADIVWQRDNLNRRRRSA